MVRHAAFLIIALTSLACGGSALVESQPALPSVGPSPQPAWTPTTEGVRLSGTVVESTPEGPRPAASGGVFFWVESRFGGHAPVDAGGRYVIAGLAPASIVRLTWMPGPDGLELHQACTTTVVMPATDTERDIDVVRSGSQDFRYDSPTLSGMVYESTADGRRPLPHTRVLYSMSDWSGFDASTETDANGRYILCRIPRGSGRLGAGDCNDAVFFIPVQLNGDTVVDVDLRPFKEACP